MTSKHGMPKNCCHSIRLGIINIQLALAAANAYEDGSHSTDGTFQTGGIKARVLQFALKTTHIQVPPIVRIQLGPT
jgi:hypothetical protein